MSETQTAELRPHHDYSPSTLQSLEACPCFIGAQSDTPHPRTVIGTIAHGVVDTGEDSPELSDEDSGYAAECIDFYESRRQLMGPGVIELKETYLPIDDIQFPNGVISTTAGYIDCALIDATCCHAELCDWKFGRWPVEHAENNLQGIAYSLGLFRKYPSLQTVRFFFKQPLIDHITDATISREQIPALYLRIQTVVARAREARRRKDFSMARPMVPVCNFCSRLGTCDKVAEFICKVGSKFSPLDIPADITPSKIHDPAQMKLGLMLAQVCAVWSTAYKNVIANRVITGACPAPEGYIIASRTPREIVDVEKYRVAALKYLTPEEFASTLKAAFGPVEKLIASKTARGQKEAAVKQFGEEAEAAGAVKDKDGYVFLQAVPAKPTK
jgi:hypothetical protein